ncbi:unnamed protein product [Prunus armeniaca]|uniref:Ubiquitin-like protease family profile domain-containing protein n=1 Tax=Prunus armeniaca TaxID=36596 RepID=A0A6J5VDX7_PRUAR|nr:unnamed protein product [Prunus armeniaca]
MDEFNNYPWGSISFEFLQDSLLFAPGKKESDEENNEKGKGQKKGKKVVQSSVRKGKKNVEDEKPKRINRPGRSMTKDVGEERNKTEDEDAGEESDKTEDGVVCVTLVKFLTNPPQKIDMSTAEGECGEDVIVGVRQKSGLENSEILGLAMKRRMAVVRETPWICREIPNISEDTIADPIRPVPRDSLLEVAKFCWEWGQEENSHVRLCGEDGMEGSHNFFVRLLTKDGWLDDSHKRSGNWVGSDWTILDTTFQVSVMMHNSCATMQKCAALDYKQMKAYVGKEDRQKHWILLVVDLKECEIKAYDSKVDMCRTQAIQRAVQPVAKMLPRLLKESGYIGDGLLLKIECTPSYSRHGCTPKSRRGRLWDVHPQILRVSDLECRPGQDFP